MSLAQDLMQSADTSGWLRPVAQDGDAWHVWVYARIEGNPCAMVHRGQFLPTLLMRQYPACVDAMRAALEVSARAAVLEILTLLEAQGLLGFPDLEAPSCANENA